MTVRPGEDVEVKNLQLSKEYTPSSLISRHIREICLNRYFTEHVSPDASEFSEKRTFVLREMLVLLARKQYL